MTGEIPRLRTEHAAYKYRNAELERQLANALEHIEELETQIEEFKESDLEILDLEEDYDE